MDRARTERCRSAVVAALGEDGFRRCWERGADLPRAAAVAVALAGVGLVVTASGTAVRI